MIIISQKRNRNVNFNNIVDVLLERNESNIYEVKCKTILGETVILGVYKSEKQADYVFESLNKTYALIGQAVQMQNGGTQIQLPVFYMPEEIKETKEQ